MIGSGPDQTLRPVGAGDLARAALRLGFANYVSLLGIVAAILVPTGAVGVIAVAYWRDRATGTTPPSGSRDLVLFVGLFVSILGNLIVQAIGVHGAVNAAITGRPDWRRSLAAVRQRLGDVVIAGLVVAVASCAALFLFIIPGVYLWVSWFVVMPVVVLERRRPLEALTRSRDLVLGRWWTVFGALFLVELVVIACALPFGLLFGIVFSSSNASGVAQQVATFSIETLLEPLQLALLGVTYLALRQEKDGVSEFEIDRDGRLSVVERRSPVSSWPPPAYPANEPSEPTESSEPDGSPVLAPPPVQPLAPAWPALSPKPPPPSSRRTPPAPPVVEERPGAEDELRSDGQ